MRRSLLSRLYRFTWRYKMTPAGKLTTAVIGVASVGTVTVDAPVYQVCCVLLGVLLGAEVCGLLFKPNLAVEADWPQTMTAGEPAAVPVRVTNRSSWRTAYDVMLLMLRRPETVSHGNADAYLARLPAGESARIPMLLTARRRGRVRLTEVDAHSTFPFNLIRVPGGRSESRVVTVLPAYTPLTRLDVPVDEAAAAGHLVLSGQAGESTEYLGNRDYAPGEPVKRLDFRAWARLGKPVVREYQDESASRVGVLVDTLMPAGRHASERLEAVVSLGAAVMDAALFDQLRVGVLATGTDLDTFPADQRSDVLATLLEKLARALPTRQPVYDAMLPDLLGELRDVAAVIAVVGDLDPPRLALLRELEAGGPPLKVVVVMEADPEAAGFVEPECPGEEVVFVGRRAVAGGEVRTL